MGWDGRAHSTVVNAEERGLILLKCINDYLTKHTRGDPLGRVLQERFLSVFTIPEHQRGPLYNPSQNPGAPSPGVLSPALSASSFQAWPPPWSPAPRHQPDGALPAYGDSQISSQGPGDGVSPTSLSLLSRPLHHLAHSHL